MALFFHILFLFIIFENSHIFFNIDFLLSTFDNIYQIINIILMHQ